MLRSPVIKCMQYACVFAWLLSAPGCASDSPSAVDAGSADASPSLGGSCASDPRGQAYAVGLSSASPSGKVKISFVAATPAPPAKGDNVWTVELRDDAGKPIDAAGVTMTLFMPDHAHGSAVTPVVTASGAPGTYTVDKIYLPMAGYWEMTFHVGEEQVVFGFCIEG